MLAVVPCFLRGAKQRHLPALEELGGRNVAEPFDERRGEPAPPGLVARAESRAGLAMEVFVEQQVIAPMRIVLECSRHRRSTGRRPCSSRTKRRVSRAVISAATSNRFIVRPEPVGHSTRNESP